MHSKSFKLSFFFLLFLVYSLGSNGAAEGANVPAAQPPSWQFKSPLAQKYLVPSRLPGMNFDIGLSYAGLLDVSKPGAQSLLFFWFIPSVNPASNDLVLWLNGGPGCSSLIGAFQENGPALLLPGQTTVTQNKQSWHNAASMLYVEHPAGVGFSEGTQVVNSEYDVADYTFRLLQKFLTVFGEMAGKNFYIAAESYGGYYAPYLAEHIYAQQAQLSLRLQGVLVVDGLFADYNVQVNVPTYDFVVQHQDVFKFNSSQMASLAEADRKCGFSEYLKKNLNYPPMSRPLPAVHPAEPGCNLWQMLASMASDKIDPYNILRDGTLSDPLTPYLNRADVRKALNVVGARPWSKCVVDKTIQARIFPKGDLVDPPAWKVLPSVIASSKKTIFLGGDLDARVITAGTKLAIQNMTWNKIQGFQNPINTPLTVNGKPAGKFNTERGFTFIEVAGAGHMIPMDQPEAAFIILQFFIGQRAQLT